MKNKPNIALTLLAIATGMCLYTSDLAAWTRKPVDMQRCQKEGKTAQRCQKETAEDNDYDFSALLSPDAYKYYEDFTPEQKKMAMDYADNNRMDPNKAVAKVFGRRDY